VGKFPKIRLRTCLGGFFAGDVVNVLLKPSETLGRSRRLLRDRGSPVDWLQAGFVVVRRDQQFVRTPVGPRN
jgi:hypothetical protein